MAQRLVAATGSGDLGHGKLRFDPGDAVIRGHGVRVLRSARGGCTGSVFGVCSSSGGVFGDATRVGDTKRKTEHEHEHRAPSG